MLKKTTSPEKIKATMAEIGQRARDAARPLAYMSSERKNAGLAAMAEALMDSKQEILLANTLDMDEAEKSGVSSAFLDRLKLSDSRLRDISSSIRSVAALPDPVGSVIANWTRPNGLKIERVRTPIGVIGVIYESRPNVTADAGALCLKSGNAVILRGGSDSFNSSRAIQKALRNGLEAAELPKDIIQMVPFADRSAVGELLSGLNGCIDVIVPRGGRSLVARVQEEARVPVFAHLEGICHVYVDRSAKAEMAVEVTLNAKMRRPGICGAAETLLIDETVERETGRAILDKLFQAGCEIRGDVATCELFPLAFPAKEEDWRTEYLDTIISVAVVNGVQGAIDHITKYSSGHTEAIIAEDPLAVEKFFNEVDSAILMHNASTQFADGGEFGMGAEIGIATGKMHARGPVGVEQLTSFKYRVRGSGQTRP